MPLKKRIKTLSDESREGVSGHNATHKETKSHDNFRFQVILPLKERVKSEEKVGSQDQITK